MQRRQLLNLGLSLGATALAAPAFIRHANAADSPRFTLGVASGHPGPSSVVLWTRLIGHDLPDEIAVRWQLAEDEGFTRIAASGTETALAADAHSVHAEPAALQPGRDYYYRFTALGQQSASGRTRTAPAPDAVATLRAAVASCQRWDHGHWAAWWQVAKQNLDLVVFVGDYIYEYASPTNALRRHDGPQVRTLAQYRDRYAQYKSDPALQAAHASAPWTMLWDDHEVQNDYAGDQGRLQSGESFLRLRAAAYQAWWEHQPVPKAMRPRGPHARIQHRLDWGKLARLHAVDCRQFRDPQPCPPLLPSGSAGTVNAADCAALFDPARSLLGVAQEQWLAEGWDTERPWNLLLQTTLMARCSRQPVQQPDPDHRSGRYWVDGWDGYPAARQRLLQGAADRRLNGLVVLGGDVHAHYVADLKADFDDPAAPVLASELCATSISSHGAAQSLTDQQLRHNPHLRYGRSDQRGYLALQLDSRGLRADLMAVARPDDASSPVEVAARFVVDPRQPGPQAA